MRPFSMLCCLTSLLLLAFDSATAQTLQERADALLANLDADPAVVGLTAAIARDGELVWSGAVGYADREQEIAATPGMVHRIASISKAMTATAAMQLVEQGRLSLDAPVQEYVPEFPMQSKGVIRVRHLLNHTSGIRHYFGKENRPMTHYPTLRNALTVFMDQPIPFAPGTRYRYTTYGYTLLGAIIEAASGKSYGEYMRAHVWAPAGMNDTSLEVKGEAVENKSRLYRRESDGSIVPDQETDLSVKYPGGGIQSTAEDLVRFAIAFMEGRLIQPATREMMFDFQELPGHPEDFQYGFGWIFGDAPDVGRYYRHDGGQSGTTSNLLVLADKHVAVAVLSSVYDQPALVQKLTWDLAHAALAE